LPSNDDLANCFERAKFAANTAVAKISTWMLILGLKLRYPDGITFIDALGSFEDQLDSDDGVIQESRSGMRISDWPPVRNSLLKVSGL
jgi:hypothetical protein